ncbi:FecR domain-containing protein [Cedecea lapagei]|uniref:FecR domain-containing protein n=1 Tax=Cedecea lapagei TaxID=158823 RepID=UPI001BCE93FC|nr:FecR family protein [Cedecea lapagei]
MTSHPFIGQNGQAIDRDSAYAAASWLTLMMSDDVSEQDKANWQKWLASSAENQRAWQHVEAVCASFRQVDGKLARQSLSSLKNSGRRRALKGLGALLLIGGSLEWGRQQHGWEAFIADYRTGTGEQRQIELNEGSRLLLDTQTALNVDFTGQQRQIELLGGDLLITTGQKEKLAAWPRPFSVTTPQGKVLALGTQFRVKLEPGLTRVAVYHGAVRLYPRSAGLAGLQLAAGQGAWLSEAESGGLHGGEKEPGWVHGKLLADNMPLSDFLQEVNRYRPGVLRYDEDIAALRLSGVFPLADTDQILAALPRVLPVRINTLSRYWVSLSRSE